jgi:dTDP-4-dehydrorhamnose reductase
MENIILTGGSSLLALNWAFFKRNDVQITLLLHHRNISMEGVNSVFLDLESYDKIYEFLSSMSQCTVIHCAAITSIDDCEKNPHYAYKINVSISENLAHICYELGFKFVHISTDHLFSGLYPFSTESSKISPLNVYANTKAIAEGKVLNKNPEALVVRTNFYGWGASYRNSFSDFLINAIREKKGVYLFTDIFYTPIYTRSLIECVHILLTTNFKGVFNIVGNERVSKYQFGKEIFKTFSGNMDLITKVQYKKQTNLVSKPLEMSLSNNKLLDSLGIDMKNLEDQIEQLKSDEVNFKKAINYL